jgi:hypothetical protein
MIVYLENAEYLGDYRFKLRFNTGKGADVDLKNVLCSAGGGFGKIFRENPEVVARFYLDSWPTLAWNCGYDISPEYLYEISEKDKN